MPQAYMTNFNKDQSYGSQHLGYGYKPRSKLDLFNPRRDRDANQEVVAFLNWLDNQDSAFDAFDQLNQKAL